MIDALRAQLKYDLIDVQEDGNCCYRPLYKVIKNDETQSKKSDLTNLSEKDFVKKIRQEAAQATRTNKNEYFTDTIKSL